MNSNPLIFSNSNKGKAHVVVNVNLNAFASGASISTNPSTLRIDPINHIIDERAKKDLQIKKTNEIQARIESKFPRYMGVSKHITRSQKAGQMLNIISQNQTFNFLLPFKTIVIMAS
jgi:hypothetical protein